MCFNVGEIYAINDSGTKFLYLYIFRAFETEGAPLVTSEWISLNEGENTISHSYCLPSDIATISVDLNGQNSSKEIEINV